MSSKVTKSVPEIEPLHSDQLSEGLQLLAEPLEPENAPGETEAEASIT
jgi:hypothetical protein